LVPFTVAKASLLPKRTVSPDDSVTATS
jgi:hypothetical protein